MKGYCISSNAFSASKDAGKSCDFFPLASVHIMDYVNRFLYTEPTLHPWDEAYLIVVNDYFGVFLDSVGKNFNEYFCIDIHKVNWSEVLFLCWLFVWFWYQHNCGFIE